MRAVLAAVVLVCGCGRLGFDPVAGGGDDTVDPEDWVPTAPSTPFLRLFMGASFNWPRGMAIARNGDVILAATVLGDIDLGNGNLAATGESLALARYAPNGTHRWSKVWSSTAGTFTGRAVVERNDRITIGGHFNGMTMLDTGAIATPAGQAFLVLEATADGVLGAVAFHGSPSSGLNAQGYAIAEASDGRRAIGGAYGTQVPIDGVLQLSTPLDTDDGYVVILGTDGKPSDVHLYPAMDYTAVESIAFDGLGNMCVAGQMRNTLLVQNHVVTATDNQDGAFVSVHRPDGSVAQLDILNGEGGAYISDVVGLPGGGFVIGAIGLGNVSLGTRTALAQGSDLVLARIDANGAVQWLRTYGNANNETASAVTVAPNGQIVAAFQFYGDLTIAGQSFIEVAGGDLAIVTFDGDGTPLRAYADGGNTTDMPYAIGVDYASGDIVVTGAFSGGTNTLGGNVVTPAFADIFLLRLAL